MTAIRAVHQALPNYWYGDAIGNTVTAMRGLLRQWGYASDVYADVIHDKLTAQDFRSLDGFDPQMAVIYHYSTGSRVNRHILEKARNVILMYHNVTPASFYVDYNAEAAENCLKGRDFLRRFSGRTLGAMAVSPYNARELEAAGIGPVSVVPCLVDFSKTAVEKEAPFKDGKTNILFVGRISPNKNHEALIKTFYFYRKHHNANSRLVLVGAYAPRDPYQKRMAELALGLGLGPEDVVFTGAVPDEALAGYYRSASAFLCLSLHEGFCIPLLEAMKFGKPVVALNSTGVADTMDGAGALVEPGWGPHEVAELLAQVTGNPRLAEAIVEGQARRVEYYSWENTVARFRGALEGALARV